MRSVRGKNVLVTGGAMGMGRMFAQRAVAEQAAAVVLWDVNESGLDETIATFGNNRVETRSQVVDVSDPVDVANATAVVLGDLGRIDMLVNNAGVVRGNQYFWETDLENARLTVDVNTMAPMYVAHGFIPAMIDAPGDCRILNLASAAGFTPNPRMAAYAASKWAVIGWSDSIRLELKQAGHDHVKVTTVCPYYTRTGMFEGASSAPLLPILDPAEVVDQAWTATLAGRPFVVLPRTVRLSEVLKGVLPIGVRDFVADRVFGVYSTMDEFTGRPDEPE